MWIGTTGGVDVVSHHTAMYWHRLTSVNVAFNPVECVRRCDWCLFL